MTGKLHYCTAESPQPENTFTLAYLHPDATCDPGPLGGMADWHCPHCGAEFKAMRDVKRIRTATAEPADSV